MSSHPPPVPKAGRSDKGPARPEADVSDTAGHGQASGKHGRGDATGEQGQSGNTRQNTTHPGFQQDR